MNEAYDLAKDIVTVLEMQKQYFQTRDRRILGQCKKAEADLHKKASLIVAQHEGKVLV